jgi:hypothetical protein
MSANHLCTAFPNLARTGRRIIPLAGAALLAFMLLLTGRATPQMPPPPARLVVTSEPAGATVTINGNKMSQNTNATFVVSPGAYAVAVSSADGKLACNQAPASAAPSPNPKAARIVTVASGDTAQLDCTAKGWK